MITWMLVLAVVAGVAAVVVTLAAAHSTMQAQRQYEMLLERVAKAAGALRKLGVKTGDRVLIYMPMVWVAASSTGVTHVSCTPPGPTDTGSPGRHAGLRPAGYAEAGWTAGRCCAG